MKLWTTEISHAGRLSDRRHHDCPAAAITAWAALCGLRTDHPAAARLIERVRGPRIVRAFRLDARELDGSDYPDAARLTIWEPLAGGWLGEDLRFLRSLAGLTQSQFAARIGISANGLAMAERGERGIGEPVMRLARRIVAEHQCAQ